MAVVGIGIAKRTVAAIHTGGEGMMIGDRSKCPWKFESKGCITFPWSYIISNFGIIDILQSSMWSTKEDKGRTGNMSGLAFIALYPNINRKQT